MPTIHGTCDDRFASVRDILATNLDEERDLGASIAVYVEGEALVDIWGGHTDPERTAAWEADTITNVWSTTKTMVALCALMLADAGQLDLHAPVARYWPEFKAAGKESIEVRHLLSHTAGLSGWTAPLVPADLYDWEKVTSLLAAQEPWWEPGTASGYHAITQGYLVGEVVRRVTGQTIGTFFKQELAEPLGADFHIGLPASEFARVSNVVPPPPPEIGGFDPQSIPVRTLVNPALSAEQSWEPAWRGAEIPAANGHGNARSVGLLQSVLSCGGAVRGRRFLSEAGCSAVFEEQARGTDLVLSVPLVFGIGYGLNSPDLPVGPNPETCFWGGWGGSIVVNDLSSRVTIAYMMNRMDAGLVGDSRGFSIIEASFAALAQR